MAKTTSINYPNDYLPIPLQEGFGLKPVSPLLRTELTSGRARQRRLYTSTPTQASVAWLFTDPESQLFEAWFRDTIKDGADWFNMPLRSPLGIIDMYVCRFVDIYEGPTIEGGNYWRYTATLELWERPILAPGWADFPDYIINSSIIDIALNREWPRP
ncbi:TPA: hypothetical protein ACGK2H_002276 [Escherichia coli]|nr:MULTISPECIES: hypothetical protein [Enterobacteriaceae]UDV54555.1 hypothetical protein LJU39_07855 [Citrobacter freundii]DAJ01197.1 MAG TPA: hypothetical protein [Caudoviricetes sp.]EFA3856755.1 hypothetical protein [Escherichia coli]EFA3895357.1 hypothetical protein [Escherichia coli]EFA7488891.1 hypothetical protein [Escherichia coli]